MAEIAVAFSGKISEFLVAPIGGQLGYLFKFTGNVETLKNELEKLRNLKADVEQEVEVAVNNVEKILNTVETWLDRVGSVEGEAQSIVEDKARFPKGCFDNWCLNLKARYVLSRRANTRTRDIVRLQQEGNFEKVSLPAPPILYIGTTSATSDSRELKLKEIIGNLNDQNISMIGICGMGGVGKTTIMEKVLKRVKDENMFDDYAMTVVSQKEVMINLQRDIAEMLGLRLEENNPVLRASRLKQRLEGRKVLIILDDVWEEFDLQALGITLQDGQRRCKIVFTSRTQGLWREFRSRRHELPLDPLPDNESWKLFKEKIGDFLDDNPEFVLTAKQIVKECAGLPLALVTLARALLGKDKHAWNDTILKLKTISGVEQKVYKSLRLSYDNLDNEEAKSLFLLCSLFKEDSRIFVESLVNMGMGLRLFKGINNIEAARDRVFTLVEHLHSRCLVSKGEAFLTVHDVVRDVSKSIATEKGSLVLEQGVTLKMSLDQTSPEHFTRISIISNEIKELPSQLQFPKLELLRSTIEVLDFPDSCFEGIAKLQVLDINLSESVLKLPSSLQSLTNLHTLCLHNCRLEDFTAIKFLKSLEILRITDYHIEELPKEIEQLTKLRLLDMSDCRNLKRISPGIISGLTVLEELYLEGLDIDWGAKENEDGRIAAQREFESLSNLYILHIVIKDPIFLPLFKNLKKFKIQIGDVEYDFIREVQNYEKTLSISGVALEKDFKFFLHHSEVLLLKGESTKSLVYELVREASQNIKCLMISETETPEYLANVMDRTKAPFLPSTLELLKLEGLDNLQQIINGPLVSGNFGKLKKLVVRKCKQLSNIFRLSNAVDVLHLEKLCVEECKSMEEVIWWEGREEEANSKLQFPNLKELVIGGESLISFCKGANEIEFPKLEEMRLESLPAVKTFFPPKVLFPKLVRMKIWDLKNMKEIVDGPLEVGSLVKLKKLNVSRCSQLRNILRLPSETDTVHLETLTIWFCERMEEVIKWEGREEDATSKLHFPKLRKLIIRESGVICLCRGAKEIEFYQLDELELSALAGVECLVSSSNENPLKSIFPHKVLFPKLETMSLWFLENMKEIVDGPLKVGSLVKLKKLNVGSCNQLRNIFRLPTKTDTVHLETLTIWNCESMEEVMKWEGREEDATSKLHFPKLGLLTIKKSGVMCFCRGAKEIEFHQLDYLKFNDLPRVECLISSSNGNPLKSIFPHKVLFPRLKEMELKFMRNVKEIWCDQPQAGSFCNLAKLYIKGCDSLKYVFSPFMATYLEHLDTLSIRDCPSLKEVITAEKDKDVGDEYSSGFLPKLQSVTLIGLSALEGFCHIVHDLEFHVLSSVLVVNCPEFKTFAPGFVHAPNLKHVQIEKENHVNPGSKTLWKENLNNTVLHLYEDSQLALAELLPFEKLKRLYVSNCKQPRNICRLSTTLGVLHSEELHVEYSESMADVSCEGREEEVNRKSQFPKLKDLVIDGESIICFCKGATEIEFHQLGKLILSSIPAVECITSISDENPMNSIFPPKVFFPSLVKMKLSSMPNMKKIWCGQPQAGSFCNLAKLYIWECDSLEYVYIPCIARYLVHLHTLRIEQCRSLKEVVAAEKYKDVEEYSNSILPKLRFVVLDCLSALGKFCHIAKDLEFPMLEGVEVRDCPEFKTFAPGFVHTPNLEHVIVDNESTTLWKENLNNTVQHLYEDQQQHRRQKQEDEKEGDNDNEINEDS